MASVALSFSTEPIAGLRFSFAGILLFAVELCAAENICDGLRGVLFLLESTRGLWSVAPAHIPPASLTSTGLSIGGLVRPDTNHDCVLNSGYLE